MDMVQKNVFGTSLALGLGIGNTTCIINNNNNNSFHGASISHEGARKIPSLTLGLSDDDFQAPNVRKVFGHDDGKVQPITNLSPPNSSVSSYSTAFTASCVKREKDSEETEVEKGSSSRNSDDDDDGNARKKLRLTKEQSALLEERFKEHSTLNPKQKQALAKQLNLRPRQVEVWFQNRRARTKLKQTEVDCEFLKRCCERLTEENQRLVKEVQELKAVKYAQPLYMQFPAATLKICPSCEKISGTNDSSRVINNSAAAAGPFVVASKPHHFFNPFSNPAAC